MAVHAHSMRMSSNQWVKPKISEVIRDNSGKHEEVEIQKKRLNHGNEYTEKLKTERVKFVLRQ